LGWLSRAFGGDARASRGGEGLLRSALLAVLERDLDRAEECLRLAAQADSRDVGPYLALGRLFRMRGELPRAIRVHENLLARGDLSRAERVASLLDLGEDLREAGLGPRAVGAYEEVLALEPKNARALAALVALRAQEREFETAIRLARRLARVERRDGSAAEAELWVGMGEAAKAEGRAGEARRAVKRALRRDPSNARAWRLLGALEAERGRDKAALAAWERVPALDRSRGPSLYPELETAYTAAGAPRQYEAYLRRLLEETPEDGPARLALARALAARGDADAAMDELRRLLARDADDLPARVALGRLLLARGRDAQSLAEYARLLELLERRERAGQEGPA
jgi:lipopolysaccharide biosynthesis regulator YciM